MHLGILADVERYHVETEGVNAPQQALHDEQAGMSSLVERQALGNEFYVADELLDLFVRVDVIVVGRLQARLYEPQEDAIGHLPVACRNSVIGIREDAAVFLDLVEHALAERRAVDGLTELGRNRGAFVVVQIENQ